MVDWSKFDNGVFLVFTLGIVYNPNTKKILIGLRKPDPYIKELTWVFPGGRMRYDKEVEDHLKDIIKEKTGVSAEVRDVVFAKTYPEKREFLSIYLMCVTDDTEAKAIDYQEIKWVNPTEVKDYFTTSLHPKLYAFLKKLEKEGL